MKNTITAGFKIVSPMFIGDANQKATDIRPPSIKGALRFWWRALNWDRFAAEHLTDVPVALRTLHAEEARLFGIAASDKKGGQGVFLLNVTNQQVEKVEQPFNNMTPSQLYLLGMGLGTFKDGNKALRPALRDGGLFSVQLLFRPDCKAEDKKSIADALYAFGLLGALGSRARHGMGSVAITNWEGEERREIPKTKQAYQNAIQQLIGKPACDNAPFTAFTQKTRIDFSLVDKDLFSILNKVGAEQQMYRSYGKKGRTDTNYIVLGRPAEQNFTDDHDNVKHYLETHTIKQHPKRVVFGLPHNYRYSNGKMAQTNVKLKKGDKQKDFTRRASPLSLHLHPVKNDEGIDGFIAVHTLFESTFLPTCALINIGEKIRGQPYLKIPIDVGVNVDWQDIRNYLDRFKQKETIIGITND